MITPKIRSILSTIKASYQPGVKYPPIRRSLLCVCPIAFTDKCNSILFVKSVVCSLFKQVYIENTDCNLDFRLFILYLMCIFCICFGGLFFPKCGMRFVPQRVALRRTSKRYNCYLRVLKFSYFSRFFYKVLFIIYLN